VTHPGQPCADPAGNRPRRLDQERAAPVAAGAEPPLSFSYGLLMMLPSALGAEPLDRVAPSRRDDLITPDPVIDHPRPWRYRGGNATEPGRTRAACKREFSTPHGGDASRRTKSRSGHVVLLVAGTHVVFDHVVQCIQEPVVHTLVGGRVSRS
jgi:hypothetical protein